MQNLLQNLSCFKTRIINHYWYGPWPRWYNYERELDCTFGFTRLIFIGSVGVVPSMSTFGVEIGFICQTISLSERENSIFSNRSTKTTSEKTKAKKRSELSGIDLICIDGTNLFQVARTWIRLRNKIRHFSITAAGGRPKANLTCKTFLHRWKLICKMGELWHINL